MWKKTKMKLLVLLVINVIFISKAYGVVKNNDEPKQQNYKSSILLNGHLAANTKAIGAKYIGSFVLLKSYPKLAVGFNVSTEKFWTTNNFSIPNNVSTAILFGIAGAHLRYQIMEQLFFQPEFSLLFGKQEIEKLISTPKSYGPYGTVLSYKYSVEQKDQTILGTHLEQHLFFYPKKDKNLIFGVSLFERVLNAKYYDADFGICGYIGINFK
jgi:hypothetical protein